MTRLEQIKNDVIQEDGNYPDWESYMDDQPYGASDYMVNEVARRYAAEMVRHNLERAAGQVDARCELAVMNTEIELI